MIRNVAELMEAIRLKEAAALDRLEIGHPTIIGNMYEGLTKALVRKSVFTDLDLKVVDGKVRDLNGKLSSQIDCMLVEGDGDKIPYTDSFIYDADRVITILEVKKSLYSKELGEAHSSIQGVSTLKWTNKQDLDLACVAFRSIAGRDVWKDDLKDLRPDLRKLLEVLATDSLTPPRIVIGYFGFTTEYSLRDAFLRHVQSVTREALEATKGLQLGGFPSLVLCRNAALVKLNGMPYGTPLVDNPSTRKVSQTPSGYEGPWWPFYASMSGRNSLLLLETIWTRLRDRFGLPASIFGEDLSIESCTPLLLAKHELGRGWILVSNEVRSEELINSDKDWAPAFVTDVQAQALLYLGENDPVNLDGDPFFTRLAVANGLDLNQLILDLVSTGLVFVDNDQRLRHLTDACAVVWLPDGRIAAADNATGRLERWVSKHPISS